MCAARSVLESSRAARFGWCALGLALKRDAVAAGQEVGVPYQLSCSKEMDWRGIVVVTVAVPWVTGMVLGASRVCSLAARWRMAIWVGVGCWGLPMVCQAV